MNEYQSMNQSAFVGYISGGRVFNTYNQAIGYTNDEYNKMVDTAKEYQQVLYDKGILTKPKTPEEINQEMQNTLSRAQSMIENMAGTISALTDKIAKLEKEDAKQVNNHECSQQNVRAGKS